VQMVTTNELTPKLLGLVIASDSPEPDVATVEQITTVLNFLTQQLGDSAYFGGDDLSLADITAGTAFPLLTRLGVELQGHPAIASWYKRITARPSWQQTELDDNAFNTWKRFVSLMIKRRQRQTAKA